MLVYQRRWRRRRKAKSGHRSRRTLHRRRRPCKPLRGTTTFSSRAPEPLFFLDYLAMCDSSSQQVVGQLVDGMSRTCRKAGCTTIRQRNRRDARLLSAQASTTSRVFIVGVVERHKKLLTGKAVKPGDALIALAVFRPAHERLLAGPQTHLRCGQAQARNVYVAEVGAIKLARNCSSRICATPRH